MGSIPVGATMRILKYTYVDVYYNKGEEEEALKERKRLEKLGYELMAEDDGTPHDYCDQYHKHNKLHETKKHNTRNKGSGAT